MDNRVVKWTIYASDVVRIYIISGLSYPLSPPACLHFSEKYSILIHKLHIFFIFYFGGGLYDTGCCC